MDLHTLAQAVLDGRQELFAHDYREHHSRLRSELCDKTICVIGAGGSIGRATAEALLEQRPKRTLLVDISENNLAEITRRLRNHLGTGVANFEAWALDYTREPFYALLEREKPDIILNFAAYKHVRSEKDHLTLAEMLRVNVVGNLQLLKWAQQHPLHRFFVISTDKSANPVSCMGASKRLMEQLIFAAASSTPGPAQVITSTRFANVLFSDGSLPASFVMRFEQHQPLAGPSDVLRYFISPQEAARLCLIAACHANTSEVLVPRMPQSDLTSFVDIAERFLRLQGFTPKHYGADTETALANLEADRSAGHWPCLFTPVATSGEKDTEEFTENSEAVAAQQPYSEIACIVPPVLRDWGEIASQISSFSANLNDGSWLRRSGKADVVAWLSSLLPSFRHLETMASLDQKI